VDGTEVRAFKRFELVTYFEKRGVLKRGSEDVEVRFEVVTLYVMTVIVKSEVMGGGFRSASWDTYFVLSIRMIRKLDLTNDRGGKAKLVT